MNNHPDAYTQEDVDAGICTPAEMEASQDIYDEPGRVAQIASEYREENPDEEIPNGPAQ